MEEKLNNEYNIRKEQLINKFNKDDDNYINEDINITNENELKDESNKNINNPNNSIILNSLFKAVQENDINEIESNLIKDNSNINTLNNNGLSLLHLSVIKGNITMVNKLLEYGANPNILSIPNKQTPLHLAYLSQESTKDNIINTLLSYNANENILDLYDNKPSDYNNKYTKNDLITPDKKNKIKQEDLYYKVNDINLNFFSTSDVKKKSSKRKEKKTKITNMKCNCIFTPKKTKNNNNNNNNNLESIKSKSSFHFSDSKNIEINCNSINMKESNINFDNNKNINTNSNIFSNNESIKDLDIYTNIKKNKNNDNNIYKDMNNEIIYNENDFNDINNLYNSNDINKEDEINILNDSLEEINKFDNIDNIDNIEMDKLLKTIITNKRKSIAERSTSKKKNKNNFNNTNSNNFLKNNIFININNSNNSCTCISTQNQSSQKKISSHNNNENIKANTNIINENNKNISEFNYNYLIKTNINNNNNFENNNNNSNSNDNIIKIINKNRIIFKNWLASINLLIYYDNFLENEIYDINQLLNIAKTLEAKELFKYINSILKTKKSGHVYRMLCKLEININLIDSKIIKFLEPDLKSKNSDDYQLSKLSVSDEKSVICGRINKDKDNKDKEEKNTLKIFLNKYNLSKLYQNFCHNGFDIIEYVLLQMYSRIPINNYILKNHLHIYNNDDRKNVLEALINETKKINIFLSSEEYLLCKSNKEFKYENFVFDNKNEIHFLFQNDDKRCNLCSIY